MKKIIYTNEDGGVSVITPTNEKYIDIILLKDVPKTATNVEVVEEDDIPIDRTFRDAWKQAGTRITHDMNECKNIAHCHRREMRAYEFSPLDIKATIPSEAEAAEAERQGIRDKHEIIQADIDTATTPEDIKAILTDNGIL